MDKEHIISELKSYISPKHYDLNDLEIIYERREIYDKGIYKYRLSFVDVYLYEDGTFYDIDVSDGSSYFSVSDYVDVSDNDSEILNELKSICDPNEYELNDWKKIIQRGVTDEYGITKYELSIGDVYLDKNNNFYDCNPYEVDKTTDILYKNLNDDEILVVDKIKRYVLPKHYDLINWKIVLKRVKKVKKNLNLYDLGVMNLYLDDDYNVVDFDRCHIIGNEFWYDFNPHPIVAGEQYTYITDL